MKSQKVARRRAVWISCLAIALLVAGCSGASDRAESTGSTRTPAAVTCNGAKESNQDDEGAGGALLSGAQLPPGDWTTAQTPPCPWALSADELLATPKCRAAAAVAGAAVNGEKRNGNGRVTFTRGNDLQLDDRVEIYTSRQNVDGIRAILSGPSLPDCYAAALQRRAADEPGTMIRDVHVTRFEVQPDATALGLGFPAFAGYAADAGFADGVDITFTRTIEGIDPAGHDAGHHLRSRWHHEHDHADRTHPIGRRRRSHCHPPSGGGELSRNLLAGVTSSRVGRM